MTKRYIIDDPTPFDAKETWGRHLESLNRLDPSSPDVVAAKKRAEAEIAARAS